MTNGNYIFFDNMCRYIDKIKRIYVSKLFFMPIAADVTVLPSVQEGKTLTVERRMRETSAKGRERELEAPKGQEGRAKGQKGRWRGRLRRRRWTGRQRRCWKRWWSRGMKEIKKAASENLT